MSKRFSSTPSPIYTPLSVRTPSTSKMTSLMPSAMSRAISDIGLGPGNDLADRKHLEEQRPQPIELQHVGAVRWGGFRMRVCFEKKAIGTGCGRGAHECRDEAGIAAARTVRAPRALDRMRAVEHDRRTRRFAHPLKAAHVDDQVTVAEERAPFGHRDGLSLRQRLRLSFPDLANRAGHLFGGHPLPLLDV